MASQTNASGIFQEDHWYTLCTYLTTVLGCHVFKSLGRKQTLPKLDKDKTFPQNLRPINLLSTTGKLFEGILKVVQRHIEERDLLNASQFCFRPRHSTTLQYMRLADHVTINFNNNMSMAAVFLDIERAFDTTWHPGLLYK
jgi:hypothetical protein